MAQKKLIVTVEAMGRVVAWLDEGKEVHMFLCPDLGCLAVYFSPLAEVPCQKHAWLPKCHMERQSVVLDDLELEPPPEPRAPDAPRTWKVMGLDVWGNAKDGYEVNNATYSGKEIELPSEPSDEQIVKALVAAGALRKGSRLRNLDLDGDDRTIIISSKRNLNPLLMITMED